VYRKIQSIQVIYYFLFLLAGDTDNLQLVIEDMCEARIHVLSMVIHSPNSLSRNIDVCLQPLIDELK
jgi:hypothetical protein